MDFERNIDPKEAIEIGLESRSIKVKGGGYMQHDQVITLKEYQLEDFIERLETFDFPIDIVFGPQAFFIKDEDGDFIELDELAGKALKYKGKFYKVASPTEIGNKGFDDLVQSSNEHRRYREDENRRSKMLSAMSVGHMDNLFKK